MTRPSPYRRPARKLLLLGALALALVAASPALATTGTVTGIVVDKEGNPLDFVDVALEGSEPASPNNFSTLTEADGTFRFSPVPTGKYRLSAFATGKVSDIIEDIFVKPGDILSFRIRLVPDAIREEVVKVTATSVELVDVRKTETSATISGDFIKTIPLQNKRIQDLVMLFPGVTRSGGSDSTDISVAGGQSSQIGYRLNGANINDPVDGGPLLDIPTAAIEGFKLITGGFNAEYGEQSTGIAEIITKSGQNTLAFLYSVDYRNTDVLAMSLPGLDAVQERWHRLLSGGDSVLGGEIRSGFALLGQPDGITTRADDHNPTPLQRVRHTIRASGPIVRDKLFFDQTLQILRDDGGTPFRDGFIQLDQVQWLGKLNWNIDAANKHKLEVSAALDVGDNSGFFFLNATPSVDTNAKGGAWSFSALDTYVFSKDSFMESRVQVTHDYSATRPADVRTGVGVGYQIPLPPGGFQSYFTGAAGTNEDQDITTVRFDWSISRVAGKHTMKTGASYGVTTFQAFSDLGPDVADLRITDDTDLGIAGAPSFVGRATVYGHPVRSNDRSVATSVYFQDKWQVTDNFTLDLGLRGDYQDFVAELFVAPRFGFSLDPIGDGKTTFRGSWGIFYDNLFANALQWTQNPDRFVSEIFFLPQYQERAFGRISIADIYKEALATPRNSSSPDAVAYLDPEIHDTFVLSDDLSAPTNKAWNLSVERRLPGNVRFTLAYSEAKRTHQLVQTVITRRIPQAAGEDEDRDRILESTGEGRYRQWSAEIQKPFADNWQAYLSYAQSKNTGPIAPPANSIDPDDVISQNGTQDNDRTHVVKLQGSTTISPKKLKLEAGADFLWQTGQPLTAQVVTRNGDVVRPFGRNTLRYPSSRQLNFNLARTWKPADGKFNMKAQLNIFNLLNDLNVVSGVGRFEVPENVFDPQTFPPLRTTVEALGLDVSRSMELGFTFSF